MGHYRRHHCDHRRPGGYQERTMDPWPCMGWRMPPGLQRDPQRGKIAGVCAGLGNYFQIKPKFIRLAVIIGSVFGFFLPIALCYAVLAFLLPVPGSGQGAAGDGYAAAQPTAEDLKADFEQLDRRLAAIEEWVTSEDYRLRQKFQNL